MYKTTREHQTLNHILHHSHIVFTFSINSGIDTEHHKHTYLVNAGLSYDNTGYTQVMTHTDSVKPGYLLPSMCLCSHPLYTGPEYVFIVIHWRAQHFLTKCAGLSSVQCGLSSACIQPDPDRLSRLSHPSWAKLTFHLLLYLSPYWCTYCHSHYMGLSQKLKQC